MTETWLTVRTPNRRVLTILLDGPLVLGRDCDGLILADQRVSRRHTCLEPAGDDQVKVIDLDSSNGTTVNGEVITGPVTAGPGDLISIGATLVSIQARDGDADSPSRVPTELDTPPHAHHKTSMELVAEAVANDITSESAAVLTAEIVGAVDEPGTLTLVFSDIEASTELAIAVGDTDWFEILRQHHVLVAAHVDAHQGRIVKNQGDGYMLCFRSARQALLASIGLQRDLERLSPSIVEPRIATEMAGVTGFATLRVRMGLHTGEVMIQDDGDLFGKHVIVASRIGALATGGQILVSSLVKQIAEPRGDIPFGPPHETNLKGIEGMTVVHEIDWRSYDPVPS